MLMNWILRQFVFYNKFSSSHPNLSVHLCFHRNLRLLATLASGMIIPRACEVRPQSRPVGFLESRLSGALCVSCTSASPAAGSWKGFISRGCVVSALLQIDLLPAWICVSDPPVQPRGLFQDWDSFQSRVGSALILYLIGHFADKQLIPPSYASHACFDLILIVTVSFVSSDIQYYYSVQRIVSPPHEDVQDILVIIYWLT